MDQLDLEDTADDAGVEASEALVEGVYDAVGKALRKHGKKMNPDLEFEIDRTIDECVEGIRRDIGFLVLEALEK